MVRFALLLALMLVGCATSSLMAQDPSAAVTAGPAPEPSAAQPPRRLPAYTPRLGRTRPVVAVVAENRYTELTDYVVPYGILAASEVAEVWALATQDGPIRMFPAPMQVEPQATTAAFDARFPEGADYVIVPAVHHSDDPTLMAWVQAQARKGATVVGVCDGVWVLARTGLLNQRKATGHWYALPDLRKQFPLTHWQTDARYVADGQVITTTGVTATVPVSLALVEAIAGPAHAARVARSLGGSEALLSAAHASERFRLEWRHKLTIAGNALAFWAHEDVGIAVAPGVDEIALALQAEVYSATYRSTAYTVAQQPGPVKTRRGLSIIPDRMAGKDAPRRQLPPLDGARPLQALDQALKGIEADYGPRTAAWVALQMEYIGN